MENPIPITAVPHGYVDAPIPTIHSNGSDMPLRRPGSSLLTTDTVGSTTLTATSPFSPASRPESMVTTPQSSTGPPPTGAHLRSDSSLRPGSSTTVTRQDSGLKVGHADNPGGVEGSVESPYICDVQSECMHEFGHDILKVLGSGTYGTVSKVRCVKCYKAFARKDIEIPPEERKKDVENNMELSCLKTLDHPHVLKYYSHAFQPGNKMLHIYTEFCEDLDLGHFMSGSERIFTPFFSWHILNALASALARCHHGLKTKSRDGEVGRYSEFQTPWETILHRDIKPNNILVGRLVSAGTNPSHQAATGKILKLGDFGTSFQFQANGKAAPSTWAAGTRAYWAPEVKDEDTEDNGRITCWSTKTDIWSTGAVMHSILTSRIPDQSQPELIKDRIKRINENQKLVDANAPESLVELVCECLSPNPAERPSALQLLAVALKYDSSEEGLQRSQSFWEVIAAQKDAPVDNNVASIVNVNEIVEHFGAKYLSALKDATFGAKEACIIMSLVTSHAAAVASTSVQELSSAYWLSRNFSGELEGGTIFHALACLPQADRTSEKCWEPDQWPFSKALGHRLLRKNKMGLLPSALAGLKGNVQTAIALTKLEENARKVDADRHLKYSLDQTRTKVERRAVEEFECLFSLLMENGGGMKSIRKTQAAKAMVGSAKRGYSNVVRKLVELGISPGLGDGIRLETALHYFASSGQDDMVTFLLENGASPNATDVDGYTPLHWAAWDNKDNTVVILLNRGANVNARNSENRTPLIVAASAGHIAVVKILVGRGADKTVLGGKSRQTALQRAQTAGHAEVVDFLRR